MKRSPSATAEPIERGGSNRSVLWRLTPLYAAALAYYSAFIWKTSFVIAGHRYFSLFDDAMISMQYARNLARGHGLVWNAGEPPVEGFSNPLWTLIMAGIHGFGLSPDRISVAVQALGAILLLALLVVTAALCETIARRSATRTGGADDSAPPAFVWVAVILNAFCFPLVYWTLSGMEVGLLALMAAGGALLLLRGRTNAGHLLLAAGTFVRMDFAIVALAFVVAGAVFDPEQRTNHVIVGLAGIALALGLQTFGRMLYFHDLLPNTYYLKLSGCPLGLRLSRGAGVLLRTLWSSRLLLVLLPLAGLVLARGASRRALAILVLPFVAMCAYSIWVGGDAWEGKVPCNRYLTAVLPLLLVAAAWPVAALASRLGGRTAAATALAVALAAVTTVVMHPHRLLLLMDPPPYVPENAEVVSRGLAVHDLTLPGARIAVAAVGGVAYFSERPIVDLLGKTDRVIAHLPMRLMFDRSARLVFVPGHLKWDYAYSIGQLKPEVVAQLWWRPREADRFLAHDYRMVDVVLGSRRFRFAVRLDSPRVRRAG